MENKSIIDRHTVTKEDGSKGGFNIATALLELEAKYTTILKRLEDLEGSMLFFVDQYENKDKPKIIIPDTDEVNRFKKG